MVTGNADFAKGYEVMQKFKPREPGWYSPEPNKPGTPDCKGWRCWPWWYWVLIGLLLLLLIIFFMRKKSSAP
jgi:hypothetical protein